MNVAHIILQSAVQMSCLPRCKKKTPCCLLAVYFTIKSEIQAVGALTHLVSNLSVVIAVISFYILNAVRCPYVRNAGRGQLSSENDVIMIIAGLVAGCERRKCEPRG